jgi:hypothetical protein
MGGVPAAVCFSLRLRRDFRVQHSYCFSLCSLAFHPTRRGTVFYCHGATAVLNGASPRAHAPSVRRNPMRLEFIRE